MARGYRLVDRDQPFLLPPSMMEWLSADHMVWFFIEAVEQLDTAVFHQRARLDGVGRRGYDPEMLLTLLMYAMAQGVSSSRKIEKLCQSDVAFRVICAQDVPDHSVIARFRQVHQEALTGLLTQTLELAAQLGMVRLGVVALDGTKISGDASRGMNRSEEALEELAEEYLAQAESTDRAEDEFFDGDQLGGELPEELHDRSGRRRRIAQALEEVQTRAAAEDEATRQEDSRVQEYMARAEQGTPGHGKYPRGVDRVEVRWLRWQTLRARQQAKYEAWLARKAQGTAPPGKDTLPPDEFAEVRYARQRYEAEVKAAEEAAKKPDASTRKGGRKRPQANVTDPQSRLMTTRNGWIQGYNCQMAASDDGFILVARATNDPIDVQQFIPTMDEIVALGQHLYDLTGRPDLENVGTILADTGYNSAANLGAPGPDRLIAQGKRRDVEERAQDEPTHGPPGHGRTLKEQMSHRLRTEEDLTTYRRRGHLIEAPNAWLKDGRGLRRFARRGLKAVQAELSLASAVTNLLKIRSLAQPA